MKVGLIGAGRIGDIHAGTLTAHPDVESLVVSDYEARVAGKLAARHGGEAASSVKELLERVDAVVIASPTDAHVEDEIQGTIVNVISNSSHGGQPYISAYSASKAALVTMTRNVAHALLPYRIRVNGLNPGWMSTPGEDRTQRRFHGATDNWLEEAGKTRPFGRLIDPKEAAWAVLFLASEESGMMTCAIVDYDQQVIGAYD